MDQTDKFAFFGFLATWKKSCRLNGCGVDLEMKLKLEGAWGRLGRGWTDMHSMKLNGKPAVAQRLCILHHIPAHGAFCLLSSLYRYTHLYVLAIYASCVVFMMRAYP